MIKVSNKKVETVIDSQSLLGSYIRFGIAIEEKRDVIARRENHSKLTFNMATIVTKIT